MELNSRILRKGVIHFSFFVISFTLNAGVINLDGTYQGENVYVQNPYNSGKNAFCIQEVTINDNPFTEFNSSAFEIPLDDYNKGQYLNIKIKHNDDCRPRILNAEVIRSKSTFEIISLKADENSLKWTTNNESNQEPLIVEQFRNNKWVVIGKVIGKGPEGYNNYNFEVNHFSGANKYRIKQKDLGNKYRYSDILTHKSKKQPIDWFPKRVENEINLTAKTQFEIFDGAGNKLRSGFGNKIDVTDLPVGSYYLNIDNKTLKFTKK